MILDTNALSALFENDPALHARIAWEPALHIPAVVIGEYRYGLLGSRLRVPLEGRLAALLAACRILEVNEETAVNYASIRHELKQAGTPIPVNDLWIAAACRQHQLALLSRDPHFDQVQGIQRIAW